MRLQQQPFEMIKNGSKTIEIRLNDEKRQALRVGDEIEFSLVTNPEEKIKTKETDLFPYKTFARLFDAFPVNDFGAGNRKDFEGIYQYYTKEEEEKYGVLGIKIERWTLMSDGSV